MRLFAPHSSMRPSGTVCRRLYRFDILRPFRLFGRGSSVVTPLSPYKTYFRSESGTTTSFWCVTLVETFVTTFGVWFLLKKYNRGFDK